MSRTAAIADWFISRYRVVLMAILVLGCGLRIATYFDLAASYPAFFRPTLDPAVYLAWSREIAGGNVLGEHPFFLSPLYPYLISPLVLLSPTNPLILIRLVQGALGLGTVLLVAGSTRRFLGKGHALGAAFLAAVYPLLLFYEQLLMILTVAVFLNALTLYLLSRFAEKRTVLLAAAAGLTLGLAVLARPNIAVFALLLPLWFHRLGPAGARLRFTALRGAALLAGIVVMVLPVTIRNAVVGNDFVPVTSSMGINLWQCNNPKAWETGGMGSFEVRFNPLYVETDAVAVAERESGRTLRPSEVSSYWQRRTLDGMAGNPDAAAGFLARKAIYYLHGFERPSNINFELERRATAFLRLIPIGFWLLGPLAVAGCILCLLFRRDALPLALLFLAYWVTLVIFYPLGRYRAPALPAVFPLAVLAVGWLFAGRRRAVLAGSLVVLGALLANGMAVASVFGVKRLDGYRTEQTTWWANRGYTLLADRDFAGAAEAFRTARDERPDAWLPWMGLAHLARDLGQLSEEERCYAEVLKRFPDHPVAVSGLGRNWFGRGRRAEGLKMAERAVELDPRDPSLRGNLAGLLMELGRNDRALVQLEEQARLGRPEADNLGRQVHCLTALGRLEEARRRGEAAIRMFPDYAPLLTSYAYVLTDLRAPSEVIRAAVRAIRDAGGQVPPDLMPYLR